MGLFDTRKKQLEALQREVVANPTPANMVALVEKYIAAKDEKRAVDVAKQAVERFPESEKCQNAYRNVRKVQLQARIQVIIKQLRKNPTAANYEQLASLYLNDLDDRNKAFEVAKEGLAKHQNNDGLHLICGQIRMARYHSDFLANDFNEAVSHLQLSYTANDQNIKALIHLAQVYAEIGAYNDAMEYVNKARSLDPNINAINELYYKIEDNKDAGVEFADDALVEIEQRGGLSDVGQDIRRLFDTSVRDRGTLQISPSKLEQYLQSYESMNGYKCSAVVTVDGKFVAGHTRGDIGRDAFVNATKRILQSVVDSAKRMDIGSFVNGEVETPIGRLRLASWKNIILALLADDPAKKQDVDRAVEKFVAFASLK